MTSTSDLHTLAYIHEHVNTQKTQENENVLILTVKYEEKFIENKSLGETKAFIKAGV